MKIRKSIFTKLIGSFILYAVATVLTFILCLLLSVVFIGEGDLNRVRPDNVIDENGNVINLDIAQKIGGWVEELDSSYNVINIYGEKQSEETSYTSEDILALTSAYGKTEYIGFYVQPENSSKRFLCIYDRDVMQLNSTVVLNETNTPDVFWLFFPLSIIEILLISLYLKKKIKNPLDKIVEGMESLKSGDDNARIDIRTEAEFEKIVDTFNVMAKQLQTEKAEKEELTRKKNQMLLELSHDIKTPVATIKSYANALEAGLVPEEKIGDTYRL
ncbi:MAG: HAMP domain-containing protein, partial [Ruminiclostridium sp.]|nr:HAMP domain-containing protein [Ruminiclostridium sp.]